MDILNKSTFLKSNIKQKMAQNIIVSLILMGTISLLKGIILCFGFIGNKN